MLGVGCWVLGVGCWVGGEWVGGGCWVLAPHVEQPSLPGASPAKHGIGCRVDARSLNALMEMGDAWRCDALASWGGFNPGSTIRTLHPSKVHHMHPEGTHKSPILEGKFSDFYRMCVSFHEVFYQHQVSAFS